MKEQFKPEKPSEKVQQWNKILVFLQLTTDRLGMPIDPEIKEAVAGCIALGFVTRQSCGGHLDPERRRLPWIAFEAPNRPEEEFVNEINIKKQLAKELQTTVDHFWDHDDAEERFDSRLEENDYERTLEYLAWQEECKVIAERMRSLIQEFNQTRNDHYPIFLENDGDIVVIPVRQSMDTIHKKIPEPEHFKEKIVEAQQQMQAFGEFLKKKFLAS